MPRHIYSVEIAVIFSCRNRSLRNSYQMSENKVMIGTILLF